MERNKMNLLPKLTKEYILRYVSQQEIFAAYFYVSLGEIDNCISTGKHMTSAVRNSDPRPSMGFLHRPDGKVVCRDFGGYFWGDCFDAAGFALGLSSDGAHNFMIILEDIAKTFNIHSYANSQSKRKKVIQSVSSKIRERPTIDVQVRNWEAEDGKYWYTQYGITREILETHLTFALNYVWVNGKLIYIYKQGDPAYGYYFGERDGKHVWKIYFPKRREYRFISNSEVVQGAHLIKEVEHGVVIKSMKDVMQLAVFQDRYDIQGVAPISESVLMTDVQMAHLNTVWTNIYTLSDPDLTGIRFGCEMRRRYNTTTTFLTTGKLRTINFGAKDLSDYTAKFGVIQTDKLLKKYLEIGDNIVNEYDFLTNELNHSYGRT